MTRRYANICGISSEDLVRYFGPYIEKLASLEEFCQITDFRKEILDWYDGYSWDGVTRVINPFSLLSFFKQERFSSYWYASGTPTFLISLLKDKPESFLALKNLEIRERVLDSFDINNIDVEPLLFQTGYLTVKEKRYQGVTESYLLGIPNLEVEESLCLNVIAEFTEKGETFAETAYLRMKESLKSGNLDALLSILKSLFSSIPYEIHVSKEAYYHSIFYAIMSLFGFKMDAEVSVSGGRIDGVLELDDKFYIMEFKYEDALQSGAEGIAEAKKKLFDMALDEGMNQIKAKGYANRFVGAGKDIYLVAFAFLGRDEIDMRVEKVE
jgi:hypothetical protein